MVGNRTENNYVIHVEFPSESVFHVVDLPGVNKENGAHIEKLKNKYLLRKETVVLHVLRADMDEMTERCDQYLTPEMDVIKVYTRVDNVIGDTHAQPMLIEKLKQSKCAIFSSKNEANIIATLNPPLGTINGTSEIYKYVWSFLERKTPIFVNEYRRNVGEILSICDGIFNEIGHQTPNPHSKLFEVRSSIEERIKEMFALHDNFKTDFDSKISLFLPSTLSTYISCLPSDNVLVAEINASSHDRFLNAVDWDPSAKKYHSQMLERSLNDSVLPAINGVVEIYERVILSSYEDIRCGEFAEEAISRMRLSAIDELMAISTELKDTVTSRVRQLTHPMTWSIDQQRNKIPNVLVEIAKVMVASRQQLASMDDKTIYKTLIGSFKHLIPNCESATKAVVTMRESVNETWTRDVETIYSVVFRSIMSSFKNLMTTLIVETQKLMVADIVEKEETMLRRRNCIDVARICEDINVILNQ